MGVAKTLIYPHMDIDKRDVAICQSMDVVRTILERLKVLMVRGVVVKHLSLVVVQMKKHPREVKIMDVDVHI